MPTKQQYSGAVRYIVGKKRAEEALGFQSACAVALEQSTSLEDGLQTVAELCVPILGAWCAIEIPRGDDEAPLSVSAGAVSSSVSEEALSLVPASVADVRAAPGGEASMVSCGLDYEGLRYGQLIVARDDDDEPAAIDAFDLALVSELSRATGLWLTRHASDWNLVASAAA